jgi:transcriptional regulator with XRE-family HTH domain
MARKFAELRAKMSPEDQRRSKEQAAAMLMALDLSELRGRLEVTQEELAERLQISQSNVSRLEKRRDMLVSTLREVVEAFGGELHLVAEFPEGSIEIKQFDNGEAA